MMDGTIEIVTGRERRRWNTEEKLRIVAEAGEHCTLTTSPPTARALRQTKFQKSRLLLLHDMTRSALNHYLSVGRRMVASAGTLLASAKRDVLSDNTVRAVFLSLPRSAERRGKPDQRASGIVHGS